MFDPVHKPAHYASGHPVYRGEAIEYSRHLGFDACARTRLARLLETHHAELAAVVAQVTPTEEEIPA